jgi:hypothetical protein
MKVGFMMKGEKRLTDVEGEGACTPFSVNIIPFTFFFGFFWVFLVFFGFFGYDWIIFI